MSDNKISKTILQYREFNQLQEYACAQETTILNLSKKNQRLEEQVQHLEGLLKSSVPTISSTPGINDISSDDSEYICLVEIAKLKEFTQVRELTLEENRKFDTYYKILNNINSKPKNEKEAEKLPTDKLLQIVELKEDGK